MKRARTRPTKRDVNLLKVDWVTRREVAATR